MIKLALLLIAFFLAAWIFGRWTDRREPVAISGSELQIADGDSFNVGTRKFRLAGIDAPEYRQSCKDANGVEWSCGKAAHAALELLLRQPGLACVAEGSDKYSRVITSCSTQRTPDVAATLVAQGMAVSDEHYGRRTYGNEEDGARTSRTGLWIGEFARPDKWRAANGR